MVNLVVAALFKKAKLIVRVSEWEKERERERENEREKWVVEYIQMRETSVKTQVIT